MLWQVRAIYGADKKLALFLDNARIHQANIVKEYAATEEINIELVWNIPYWPDFAGIELHWAEAKRRYRKELDRLKAHNRRFDHQSLVQTVLEGIDDELVKKQARHGEKAITTG